MITALMGWIVLGFVTSYVASSQINRRGEALTFDLGLGIAGAVAAGWLLRVYGPTSATGLTFGGALVAVLGAATVLAIGRIIRRSASND